MVNQVVDRLPAQRHHGGNLITIQFFEIPEKQCFLLAPGEFAKHGHYLFPSFNGDLLGYQNKLL